MKEVLFITSRSDIGGGPLHLNELLNGLKKYRVNTYVAAPKGYDFSDDFKRKANLFFDIPHRRFSLLKFLKILSFLSTNKNIMIHTHGRGAGLYGFLLKALNFRVVHTFHGVHSKKGFLGRLQQRVELFLLSFLDSSIFVSASERKTALSLGFLDYGQTKIISNGIHIPKGDKLGTEIKTLGVLSRFDPQKNVLQAIKFFKELKFYYPDLNLLIAGNGEENRLIEKEVLNDSSMELLGFVKDKGNFFNNIDLLISASLGEGLPLTILESMAYQTPVICSNVNGHTDLLSKGELFELNDFQSFKRAFENIKDNYSYYKDRNYNKVIENYTVEQMLKRTYDVY